MKTFKDLVFNKHPNFNGVHARLDFDNGYGISVVRFRLIDDHYGSYTSNDQEWEVAIFKDGHICYDTPITSDVIGYCSSDKVEEIMLEIQKLEKNNE